MRSVHWLAIPVLALAVPFQSTRPPARAHHSLVYDAAFGQVLLFGGSTTPDGGKTYTMFDDAWAFDGRRWRLVGQNLGPRSGIALAYDSTRRRVFGFGGFCPCHAEDGGRYADLREWRDGRWHEVSVLAERPSTDGRMVYDARRDRLVLVGGAGPGGRRLDDTWEYDGTSWRRFDGAGPGARVDFAMAHDTRRGRTVVFGGFGPDGPLGDTWEFDGAAWTRVASTGPSARGSVSMTFDSTRGRSILYGRGTDTWAWDGRVWTLLSEQGPPARYLGPLAYDDARDRVVLFGGRPGMPNPDVNDTWEWDGTTWAAVR